MIKLTFISTITHVITFISMGLASVYENKFLGFFALVSLAVGLLVNKMINEHAGYTDEDKEQSPLSDTIEDPYINELLNPQNKSTDSHK